ncbi:hypothetical protein LUZ60_016461 [Juncus effusus]|nr:hypothetical protein LUZ60_016461 [Juncus effusus]
MRGFFFMIWFFFLLTTPTVVHSQALVKPGCQPKCGDVDIPYPFGLSPDCSMEGFQINCTMINGTYKPFVFNIEIQNILLPVGRARMKNNMSWECYNATSTTNFGLSWRLNFRSTPYRFSDVYNKFTTIGCETLAYIKDSDITKPYQSGCVSMCSESQNGPGYLCNCTNGYQGNPYLLDGCQDIDECANVSKYSGKGNCRNTPGSYICVCPSGTHNTSYSNGLCVPDQKLKLWVKLVIGLFLLLLNHTHGYQKW